MPCEHQVATAGKYDYLGERCIFKSTRQPTTVMATCTTQLYTLNKWDLLKRVDQSTVDSISNSAHNQIDEKALAQHYIGSRKWESYKKALINSVIQDHHSRKERDAACLWTGFDYKHDSGRLPSILKRWRC